MLKKELSVFYTSKLLQMVLLSMSKSTNGLFERTNALNYPLVKMQRVSKMGWAFPCAGLSVSARLCRFACKEFFWHAFFTPIPSRSLKLDKSAPKDFHYHPQRKRIISARLGGVGQSSALQKKTSIVGGLFL